MKILWVKCDFLHPTTKGGQIRTLETLRRLHERHEIHYVAFQDPGRPEGLARAGEYSTRAYPVTLRTPPRASLAFAGQLLRNLFSTLPLSLARYRSDEMRRTIERLLNRERFDSMVCDFLSAAPNIPNLDRAVLFQHNVETVIWRRLASQGSLLKRTYFGLQADRMLRYESDACRRAGRVIAVSPDDARLLTEMGGAANVAAIPTGVDISYFASPSDRVPPTADLVFVGSMDWMPNIDGVRWFLERILPLIHGKRPATTVAIVGRKPSSEFVAAAKKDSRIRVTGTLPDIRPWLWGSSVSIVPLRIGGGTRLKIYEAMAARVPVVSTAVGAEGLDIHPPHDIRIADTPEDFAAQCLELLEDPATSLKIVDAAWKMVASEFSWEQVALCFSRILESSPRPR
jgi:glycosyltransferase involved in cell wall biosynthesis